MPKTLRDYISASREKINELSADDLAEWLEDHEDFLLIDVREPYEYAVRHIPNALLVPRGVLESAADPHNARRLDTLCQAQDKTIVLYCDTGARSAMATATLQDMGFPKTFNLAGGIKLWEAEDYDLESGEYAGPLP